MKAPANFPLLSGPESFPETMLEEPTQLCRHTIIFF